MRTEFVIFDPQLSIYWKKIFVNLTKIISTSLCELILSNPYGVFHIKEVKKNLIEFGYMEES